MRPLVLLWSWLVLPGYGALVGPKEVREFEGGTVSLQCTYREELRKNKKYWCRKTGLFLLRCSDAIYIDDGQEKTEGRVSIQDSPQELTFHVTLTNLSVQDTGKYWCGVKMLGLDETFLVSLTVLPGSSPHAATSPNEETSPHKATSPHAGTSSPAPYLNATSTEDNRLTTSSRSKSRTSRSVVRILAPVLVLLTLLLATGLAALGRYMLQCRKKAQQAMQTQRNEKVYLSHLNQK
ncbi:CMRF35-like molecule 9 isoform X5 [Rhinolophus sinicus]|uniref:CMRF35-like molecule 9 isoform X5 n=1 Tax=Rhinolophus sinicus TaxID=89399 RepID=UPI003D7A0D25